MKCAPCRWEGSTRNLGGEVVGEVGSDVIGMLCLRCVATVAGVAFGQRVETNFNIILLSCLFYWNCHYREGRDLDMLLFCSVEPWTELSS